MRFGLFFTTILVVISCSEQRKVRYPEGEKLAKQYCVSCHEMPDPEALSVDLWQQILPRMGARLGFNFSQAEAKYHAALRQLDLHTGTTVLSKEEWESIQNYYLANSPDTLPAFTTDISGESFKLFKPRLITVSEDAPAASLVRFDSSGFWYGDALNNRVYYYDFGSGQAEHVETGGAPSDIIRTGNEITILTMGEIFPNDYKEGQLVHFGPAKKPSVLLDSLNRPVHMTQEDLNGDGLPDLVICGFGHLSGSLDWYEKTGNGYTRHVLRAEPGAIRAETGDFNGDGNVDILALMAQGREGFYVYLGDGSGNFTEKLLYSFPSYYGSSYFELKDMNQDGLVDIIYANGDSGDYNYPALKPYHAIRILLQTDLLEFEEVYSFPIHGPFNTMADDYDLDGDIDLAVTSYFPDFENTPQEGFLFLENQGDLTFTARSLPEATWGNWLTADRADYDNDGDLDILLGNGPVIRSRVNQKTARIWQDHPNSVILLENTAVTKQ